VLQSHDESLPTGIVRPLNHIAFEKVAPALALSGDFRRL
jgi:hypothetical protein